MGPGKVNCQIHALEHAHLGVCAACWVPGQKHETQATRAYTCNQLAGNIKTMVIKELRMQGGCLRIYTSDRIPRAFQFNSAHVPCARTLPTQVQPGTSCARLPRPSTKLCILKRCNLKYLYTVTAWQDTFLSNV